MLDCRIQDAKGVLTNQNTRTTYCSADNNINLASKEPNLTFQNIKGQRHSQEKKEDKKIATNLKRNKETTQETRLAVRRTLT